ncbi:MAG: cytochrome c5 family protein [Burkholderiaceae bacterium]|nr:cytochrome c5 family protein [Burkholderiaceae bacterium]
MSDAAHTDNDSHEGPIRTPKQLVVTVVAAFVLPVVIIIMLINFVASDTKPAAGSEGLSAEAVARRIAPVGVSEFKDPGDVKSMKTGEQVFQAQCAACHNTGAAGAPKLGDEAAWSARIKTGLDALLGSSLKGKGNMPPQGGGDHSDFEIARAVVFMANKSGAKFDEPKPPAAAASAAAAK